MFYSCVQSPVTVDVNTLASKRSELIGNAAIGIRDASCFSVVTRVVCPSSIFFFKTSNLICCVKLCPLVRIHVFRIEIYIPIYILVTLSYDILAIHCLYKFILCVSECIYV